MKDRMRFEKGGMDLNVWVLESNDNVFHYSRPNESSREFLDRLGLKDYKRIPNFVIHKDDKKEYLVN